MKTFLLSFLLVFTFLVDLSAAEQTIVYLTRHGETHWNRKKLWQGSTDTFLTVDGIQQATEKAKFFKDMPITAIYCSPLQRAYLTACIIASAHEKTPTTSYGLIEPWLGCLEGMHSKDVHTLIDAKLNGMTQEERQNTGYLEGLMSDARLAERVELDLKKMCEKHPGKTIVAVSHSTIIEALLSMQMDAIHETVSLTNMAYLKYGYDGEKLTLLEISPDIKFEKY